MPKKQEWKVQLDRSIARLRAQVEQHPDDANSWVCLAMVLEDAWRDHEAMSCYRKALELAPGDESILGLMEGLRHAPQPKGRPQARRPSIRP